MSKKARVLVWSEYRAEKRNPPRFTHYPGGLHMAIAEGLSKSDFDVSTAVLDDPEHGLSVETLTNTDVLVWWGHVAHAEVSDEIVDRVQEAVLGGMGLLVLHSGHHSKLFRRLTGTTCNLAWREQENGELVRIWTAKPGHSIAQGLPSYFEIERDEMYGEPFDIPEPDELVFMGWYEGGEVFRSGCCFYRGKGRIFYFSPGHETFPVYLQPEIQTVINNGVKWAMPTVKAQSKIVNTHRPEPIVAGKHG